ncbi:tyrosine-protein phosphatase [Paenibacillus albicereus]|uniref:Tyrosine-protein phosphatase n=1 Tax=Paenibacillus albicereus TaxID=2726185 RepID=A0A6H2GYY4_9BACL|nr:tyrosine-protein phosphatase [Paenibacillus albicereus]QJC52644.1 tyrosine-protein phosphatase [Paenibacillus albicereus]
MESITEAYERRILLEGACNVRDIGSYPAAGGGAVACGRLLRADGLHRLSGRDRAELLGRGLRLVIDLRTERELAAKPNVFADGRELAYRHVSLLNPALPQTAPTDAYSLGDLYIAMLDGSAERLREIFGLIAAEPGAVLFHCAGGKDRTGVVAALLLQLAGVDDATIIADYAETERNLAPMLEELRAERPQAVPAEAYEPFLGSPPIHMERMLEHLHRRYGGAEAYLRGIGLSEEELGALREKLLMA